MIKNVIFDLGRVIYTYWPQDYLLSLGYEAPKSEALMKLIFDSPLWVEMDRGTCSLPDAIDQFCRQRPELSHDVRRVLHNDWVDDVIHIMPETLDFFYELKQKGYKIYILSNFCEESFAKVYARDSFFKDADGMIISAHVKLIKPDRAIYEVLTERYALSPRESVFIDDNAANIEAAEAYGIHGILFTNIADCKLKFDDCVNRR